MPAYQNPHSSSYVESSFGDAFGSQMPYKHLRSIKISPWGKPVEIEIGVDPGDWNRNSESLLKKPYKRLIKEVNQIKNIYGENYSALLEIGSVVQPLSWWLESSEQQISDLFRVELTEVRSRVLKAHSIDLGKKRAELSDAASLSKALATCQPLSLDYDFKYQGKSIFINGARFLEKANIAQKQQVLFLLQQGFVPDPKKPGEPLFQKGKPKLNRFRVKFSDVEDKVTWSGYFEAWKIDI